MHRCVDTNLNRSFFWKVLSALIVAIFSGILSTAIATAQDSPGQDVLLFSYHTGNGENGLHLAYSKDGYHWKALNNGKSVLKPAAGKDRLMRDPCIIRGGDGNFHMVWTVSWGEKGIGYAFSKDLVHWSRQQYIPAMKRKKDALNAWAPEITYDNRHDRYMIYWATTIPGRFPDTIGEGDGKYNHRIYYTLTNDIKNFSDTRLLYDQHFNVIDATIKPLDDRYIMFIKNETRYPPEKNVRISYANNLTGPYGKAGKPTTGNYWAEGPSSLKLGDRWIVYFDKYRQDKMGAVTSIDRKTRIDISDRISFPKDNNHGTVFRITQKEFKHLKEQFGQ